MGGDDFLLEWHARHPGATSLVFADWHGPDGGNGYEILADIAATAGPDGAVLDLACGDGYLLELIGRRPGAPARRAGLDMSPQELAAARARHGDAVALHLGRAEAIPLPDASLDVVTCHMAFMLMSQAPAVAHELARVLRPGGRFAAIIGTARWEGAWGTFLEALVAEERREGTPPLDVGHPSVASAEGLEGLFAPPRWASLALSDHRVTVRDQPDGLFDRLSLMYNFDQLSPSGQQAVRATSLEGWRPSRDKDGLLSAGMTVRLIQATRAD